MVTDKATSVTVSDILASACGDLRPAMMAVAQLANHELAPGGTNDQVSFLKPLGFYENLESIKYAAVAKIWENDTNLTFQNICAV